MGCRFWQNKRLPLNIQVVLRMQGLGAYVTDGNFDLKQPSAIRGRRETTPLALRCLGSPARFVHAEWGALYSRPPRQNWFG